MRASLANKITKARALVPAPLVRPLIRVRAQRASRGPELQRSRDEMDWILRDSSRAGEIDQLATARLYQKKRRGEMRYHPRLVTSQHVENLDILTGRDQDRAYVLNFMHHGGYDGMFASIERHGVHLTVVAAPGLFQPGGMHWYTQHLTVCGYGGSELITTEGGVAALTQRMQPGVVLAIASDREGATVRTFLGGQFRMSSGAARIAYDTNSPVIVVTSHPDETGQPVVTLHPALEPRDYPSPLNLLDAMIAIHEPPVLAWPEAADDPFTMWKRSDS